MESSCINGPSPKTIGGSPDLFSSCRIVLYVALLLVIVSPIGCASMAARQKIERVAKDWAETIRASQVIPVYPLTEDLVPGDVFLVQTSIEEQEAVYRSRGFLPLDDHITRLKGINYRQMYFQGYWKDEFGNVPHDRPRPESAGATNMSASPPRRTEAKAPRAAFPTYTFEASTRGGLALALPIKGIPVGLDFLRTDRVSGTVTIADARTFAAEQVDLYSALDNWIKRDPTARKMIRDTLRQTSRDHLFLRVVSRVYLSGAVVVSLQRSDATGAGVRAGNAPTAGAEEASGIVAQTDATTLKALNERSSVLTEPLAAGGSIKFASASASSVTLTESFDRLLAIGYLGFDVPVFQGGVLGAPIPTFERIEGRHLEPVQRVDVMSFSQQHFKVEEAALEALVNGEQTAVQAHKVMVEVIRELNAPEFSTTEPKLAMAERSLGTPTEKQALLDAFRSFKIAAGKYVSAGGTTGPRYDQFSTAFVTAYDKRDE